jgi:tetratricopeptide (TPR) repeat protein
MNGDVLLPVLIVIIGGCFGGFLRGLRTKNDYHVNLPFLSKPTQLGVFGDVLNGAAGGLVVFLLLASLLHDKIKSVCLEPSALIQVLGITAVAGFLGPQILKLSSEKLFSGDDLDRLENVEQDVKKMEKYAEANNLIQIGEYHTSQRRFSTAIRFYQQAFDADPSNDFALTREAHAWKRLKPPNLSKAIEVVTRAIDINPANGRAWYNLACYKALLGHTPDEVINHLKKAIALTSAHGESIYIAIANEDTDFDELREVPEFQALLKIQS